MSHQSRDVDPVRRRAGLLGALARLYEAVHDLIQNRKSKEVASDLLEKLTVRYASYLEVHEIALDEQTDPEKLKSISVSHEHNENRHKDIVEELEGYIADGATPCDEKSLSSKRSSTSQQRSNYSRSTDPSVIHKDKRSSKNKSDTRSQMSQARSERLSESRVQAKLAEKEFQQAQKRQQIMRQKRELEFKQQQLDDDL